MSLLPAKPKLTPAERRARQADKLTTIRLRMAIWRELEDRGAGPWGGPSYAYRGARIKYASGGHVCGLFMPEYPLHGCKVGVVGTVTTLVDLWTGTGRLPSYMRQGRKSSA
jgi:hypothetical protein